MKWLALALAAAAAVVLSGAAWLLGTEAGLHWAAARAQAASGGKLVVEGLRGALLRDIGFAALGYADAERRVVLAEGELRLDLLALLGGLVDIVELRAQTVEIALADTPSQAPSEPPALPLGVRIHRAELARIAFRGHVLEDVRLRDAIVRPAGALSAAAALRVPHERYPAQLSLQLRGRVERIDATATGEVAGIPVSAKALVTPGAAQALAMIDARAGPIDARRLEPRAPRTELTLRLTGKPAGDAALAGTLSLENAIPGALDQDRLPVRTAEARFSTDFASARLGELRVALAPHGALAGSGTISRDRAQLDLRASAVDLRSLRSTLRETRLSGPLQARLSAQTQSVQGSFEYEGMQISADVVRSGDLVQVRSARAVADGGRASGSGRIRLGEPLRFEAQLALEGFDPARFGEYPAGRLSGRLEGSGALGRAAFADLRWQIADSTLAGRPFASRGAARVSLDRVTRAEAQASLGATQLRVSGDFGRAGDAARFVLQAPELGELLAGVSGRLQASGTLSGSWRTPSAHVEARAEEVRLPNGIALERVTARAEGTLAEHAVELGVAAEALDLTGKLRGGWRADAGWAGELLALRNAGRYPLALVEPAPLRASRTAVRLGRLAARLGEGRLVVEQLRWSEGRLATQGEFEGLPAQWLLLAAGLDDRARASLLLDGAWNVRAEPRLEGTLSLARSAGDLVLLEGEPLALELRSAVLQARFEDGQLRASGEVSSKFGAATLEGRIEPQPGAAGIGITPQSPAQFSARVRFAELGVLTRPISGDARFGGRLAAEIAARGTLGELRLTGSLTGEALALEVPPYGVFLEQGRLRAELQGDALRIEHFSIRAGDGRLVAQGSVPLRAGVPARLEWRAEQFRLLARSNLRLTVSGAGEAQRTGERIALVGALHTDQGFLDLEQERLPQLGDDVVIVGAPRPPPREGVRVPVALDIALDLGNDLEVRGHGLEGKLTGRLQVNTTEAGELRVRGRIETVNATFLAYGQRLQVDPGVAIFDGPLDNPTLQMTAWRRNQQVEAGVQITGTARNPRVQLVSQPPVPEGERLSWLVLGRPPGEATKADLGLLQAAAGALLADGERAPLDRRIARAFGLDEISLRGSGEAADRVVAVGKRLSDRLYVSYEQGLGTVASALVKLDLELTQRLSARAQTGTSSGVGLFYRFSWD